MLKIKNKWAILLACMVGANLVNIPRVWAGSNFQLTPNSVELRPSGRGIMRNFYVTSTGTEPVAVQVRMMKWGVALDGTETQNEEEEDFLVYPPQMIINPGQRQVVRVTWLGDPEPDHELIYKAVFEQLPINLRQVENPNPTGIVVNLNVTVTYIPLIYVTPDGASANIVVDSITRQTGADGKEQLAVTFENQGNRRGLFNNLSLAISSPTNPENSITVAGTDIKDDKGAFVLAGSKRQFILPLPDGVPAGDLVATLEAN
ncbi:type 7 secretion system fimbrial chaperone FimC [Cyanobacterium sp. HL-69]|uniref:fimbrial biogenesis chaperone n=1 Tax=Cyanobacterium sp. HL-69 TaxID=2054282 RepID=UPI000CA367B7|nr:type 7 secretion system fimbrial chaperone FimC [Cyanobacterium sp. HL-69]